MEVLAHVLAIEDSRKNMERFEIRGKHFLIPPLII